MCTFCHPKRHFKVPLRGPIAFVMRYECQSFYSHQRKMVLALVVVLALIHSSRGFVLDIFRHLDIHLLDEKDYCEIVTDLPHIEEIDWFGDLSMYVSFNGPTCHPALLIKSLNISYNDQHQQICQQRSGYIKDSNVT